VNEFPGEPLNLFKELSREYPERRYKFTHGDAHLRCVELPKGMRMSGGPRCISKSRIYSWAQNQLVFIKLTIQFPSQYLCQNSQIL
jgi:hypothetical protein